MVKKIILIVVAALALAASLFFAISAYFNYSEHYEKACVASHQLYQRTKISEEDLKMIEVPKEYLGSDVYYRKQDVLGKYVKMSYSLAKGSLFYKGALEEDIKDLANSYLNKGEVNFDLYANEVKINSGGLSVDMYVDLYLSINTNDKPLSDLLIRDCRITGLYDSQGKRIMNYDYDTKAYIVSLAIEEDQVNFLNKALMVGNISAIVSSDTYEVGKRSMLNSESEIIEYVK